jgi:MFS family permease
MLAADVIKMLAVTSLVVALALDRLAFAQIAIVAFLEGTAAVFFSPAASGALRSVVPAGQLPAAAGAEQARLAAVHLAGPPLGGALFGLGRLVPFLADAISYVFSLASILAIRTPFQEERALDTAGLRAQIAEGVRFLWRQPFLRTTALIFAFSNVTIPALMLAVVVIAKRQGLTSGQVGALVAAFGACMLGGSLIAGYVRRRLSMRAILLAELWSATASVAFVLRPSAYVLMAGLLPQAFLIPVTDTVLTAYRMLATPDRLLGRTLSVTRNIAMIVASLGPLLAGFLLGWVSARTTVGIFAAVGLSLALWGTLSPSIRQAPKSLAEIEPPPVGQEPSLVELG